MIRNLRKYGDEEKQLMLLKESLALRIKNDEAIASARAGFQQGKPLEPSVEDNKTLAERIADDDKQMSEAGVAIPSSRIDTCLIVIVILIKDIVLAN